jgi:hypothetical protein
MCQGDEPYKITWCQRAKNNVNYFRTQSLAPAVALHPDATIAFLATRVSTHTKIVLGMEKSLFRSKRLVFILKMYFRRCPEGHYYCLQRCHNLNDLCDGSCFKGRWLCQRESVEECIPDRYYTCDWLKRVKHTLHC